MPPGDCPSNSFNLSSGRETFHELLSNFCAAGRTFIHFRQLSVWLDKLLSSSVNFSCGRDTFCQLLSTLCVAWRFSDNFSELSELPREFLTISVNCTCSQKTLCLLFVQPGDLPSTSVNFPLQLGDSLIISVNFLYHQENFCQCLSTLHAVSKTTINFPCGRETFRQLLSTFCAAGRPSVNFCQLSVRPGDIPSTSVYFPCGQENFGQLLSAFHVARKLTEFDGRSLSHTKSCRKLPESLPEEQNADRRTPCRMEI